MREAVAGCPLAAFDNGHSPTVLRQLRGAFTKLEITATPSGETRAAVFVRDLSDGPLRYANFAM